MLPTPRLLAKSLLASASLLTTVFLTSCSGSHQPGSGPIAGAALKGILMGGQQPISGATIQLYAVGTSGDGSAATALLSTTVTTSDGSNNASNSNANSGNGRNSYPAGEFTISGDYTCPSDATLVYLTASQGNPGLGSNNPQSELMVALGTCGNLRTNVTFLNVNEVTTVGSVRALYPYMTSFSAVGSATGDASSLATAFTTAAEYMSLATGTAPGPSLPSGYYASSNETYALANSIAACINSAGGTYGDSGSACGLLFKYTKPASGNAPTDTISALIDLFASPNASYTNNIYYLASATPPFASNLSGPPADWTLPIVQVPSTPTFYPSGATYAAAQSVTLSVANADTNTVVYYTTDGSTPSASNGTKYTSAITVSSTETLKAVSIESGRTSSSIGTAAYTINPALTAPTVSLASISAASGSTSGVTIAANSNANGSVVTFGTTGSIGGSFSPATCTIAAGTCSVSYTPSGTLSAGTYANDLTASFAAVGSFAAGNAASTLTVTSSGTTTTSNPFSWSYNFLNGTDGSYPTGGLTSGPDGKYYGVAASGGSNSDGNIFSVTPNGTSSTLAGVYQFTNGTDGNGPFGGMILAPDGNFYGTTGYSDNYNGNVFRFTPNGSGGGTVQNVYTFAGFSVPSSSVILGLNGNLYGTTLYDPNNSSGSIFEVSTDGTVFKTLYTFTGAADGCTPTGLIQDASGNLYGVSSFCGANNKGNVFELTPNETTPSASVFTPLYQFGTNANDGYDPMTASTSALVQGSDGNLYGTTQTGGANGDGIIFQIVPNGSSSVEHDVYDFGSLPSDGDGKGPVAGLILGSDGYFYGTTPSGGPNSTGTVFQFIPNSTGTGTLHVLSSSVTSNYGPTDRLLQGPDGNFWGDTNDGGTIRDSYYYAGEEFALPGLTTLAPAVTLTVPAAVTHSTSFNVSVTVPSAAGSTMSSCFAGVLTTTSGWHYTLLGKFTGSPTTATQSFTAPTTPGTYTFSVTCGGMNTSTSTLTVN